MDISKEMRYPENMMLGYAYVPIQTAQDTNIYGTDTGLERGTIFPTLDLPLGVYGRQIREKETDSDD